MRFRRLHMALAVGVLLLLIGGVFWSALDQGEKARSAEAPLVETEVSSEPRVPVSRPSVTSVGFTAPQLAPGAWNVRFLDDRTRAPIPGVHLDHTSGGGPRAEVGSRVKGESDDEGILTVPQAGHYRSTADGYAPKLIDLSGVAAHLKTDVVLSRGGTLAGVVKDLWGKPVRQTQLSVTISGSHLAFEWKPGSIKLENVSVGLHESDLLAVVRTDDDGRFVTPMLRAGRARLEVLDASWNILFRPQNLFNFLPGDNQLDIVVSPVFFVAGVVRRDSPFNSPWPTFDSEVMPHAGVIKPEATLSMGTRTVLYRAVRDRLDALLKPTEMDLRTIEFFCPNARGPWRDEPLETTMKLKIDGRDFIEAKAKLIRASDLEDTDASAFFDITAPKVVGSTRVAFHFTDLGGSPASHVPPFELKHSRRGFGSGFVHRTLEGTSHFDTLVPPGEYTILPWKLGSWTRAWSFEEKTLRVDAVQSQTIEVRLTKPVAVIRPQVHNRFGEPITHYYGSWSQERSYAPRLPSNYYIGDKMVADFTVTLSGFGANSGSQHRFTRTLALGEISDVVFTLPVP